jgi:hypothetical protein
MTKGRALASEEDKIMGSELFIYVYDRRKAKHFD